MSRIVKIETGFGMYHAVITAQGVQRLAFPRQKVPSVARERLTSVWSRSDAAEDLEEWVRREIQAYHEHCLTEFTVPLDIEGHTSFRLRVWEVMCTIPYGQTMSYGELARRVKCGSPRPVGQACGANPVPVIIPCHRVVAANGRLGGWGGPPGMKERLLELEGALL